ncbi:hypothetical protein M0811_13606 [Anaeramoeba ignava]|uniref:Uncharacterized protein n=1 Tax=Anaeramoeba ignava TaxID=1746090 RepID=A0A9Q0R465_ANAIG|nr:hypothetical protein M0811_13606 [Anaeramoeba ignava]
MISYTLIKTNICLPFIGKSIVYKYSSFLSINICCFNNAAYHTTWKISSFDISSTNLLAKNYLLKGFNYTIS